MKTKILLFLLILSLSACAHNSEKEHIPQIEDTVIFLLNKSLLVDTLEYAEFEPFPFLFFKSGNIIDKNQKNAIAVFLTSDTAYTIKLYDFEKEKWRLIDTICNIKTTKIIRVSFDIKFKDYNFDNQTDFYIQVAVSNGHPIIWGNLITINPKTKKMELHNEANDLGNLTSDYQDKCVYSAMWNWADYENGISDWTVSIHKWENGKLKFLKDKQVSSEEYHKKYCDNY